MIYNKHNEPYEILSRFSIFDGSSNVEYCRIKFFNTGNIKVVKAETEKKGDFKDDIEEESAPVVMKEIADQVIEAINSAPQETEIEEQKIDLEVGVQTDVHSLEILALAINPDGAELPIYNIQEFAESHKLDPDAIEACLEGKQKTHRKWRFQTV